MMNLLYAMLRGKDSAYKAFKSEGWSAGAGARIVALPYNKKFVKAVYGGKVTGIDLNKAVGDSVELAMPLMNPKMETLLRVRIAILKSEWVKVDDELQLLQDRFGKTVKELSPDRAAIRKLEKQIADAMKWSGAVYSKCKPGEAACKRVLRITASSSVPLSAVKDVLNYLSRLTTSLKKLENQISKKEMDKHLIANAKSIANAKKRSGLIVKQIRSEIRAYNELASAWPTPKPAKL